MELDTDPNAPTVTKRPGRQLPALPGTSKIPVRRDQSLPSSGRSTPCHVTSQSPKPNGPGLKREGSSPPGLLFTGAKPRPALAPKPSLTVTQRQGGSMVRSCSGALSPVTSTISKIPRPSSQDGRLKKWDSTSRLEVKTESCIIMCA